jgi:hypothetical protein
MDLKVSVSLPKWANRHAAGTISRPDGGVKESRLEYFML